MVTVCLRMCGKKRLSHVYFTKELTGTRAYSCVYCVNKYFNRIHVDLTFNLGKLASGKQVVTVSLRMCGKKNLVMFTLLQNYSKTA